jgi:hypothetical protein
MTRLSVGTSTERRFFAALNTVTKYDYFLFGIAGFLPSDESLLRYYVLPEPKSGKSRPVNNVQLGFCLRLSTLVLRLYDLALASDWIGQRLRLSVA